MDDCLHIFLPGQPFSDTMLREYDLDPARIELRYEAIDEDPFIEFAANQILREMSCESAGGRLFIETLGMSLSAHLIRSYSGSPAAPAGTARAEKPLDSRRLLRVEDYVDFHLDNDLSD